MNRLLSALAIFFLCSFCLLANAQEKEPVVIDKIIAVVGNTYVLQSELELRFKELKIADRANGDAARCELLRDMIEQKILFTRAAQDSILVSDEEVASEIDRRLGLFIQQFGSEEALEKYFKKSIDEIRQEFQSNMKEQMMASRMQNTITAAVTVSPREVKEFYKSIPEDSLPFYNATYEVMQVVRYARVSIAEKKRARQQLKMIRKEIVSGQSSFASRAILFSQDPGSQSNGGDLGYLGRGDLVPEFAEVAFKLQKDSVSDIVETKFGYHIIQMLDRKGDNIRVRHILIKPQLRTAGRLRAKNFVDSVRNEIIYDTLEFNEAAYLYSDDEDTKNNGGVMFDPMTNATEIPVDRLDPAVYYAIKEMKVGEITEPQPFKTREANEAYRIIKVVSMTEPHTANLKQDYPKIQEMALQKKRVQVARNWLKKNIARVYFKVDEDYGQCSRLSTLAQAYQKQN